MVDLPWISGSDAHWLVTCPRRWLASAGQTAGRGYLESGSTLETTGDAAVGIAVHAGLARWMGTVSPPVPATLRADLDAALMEHDVDIQAGRVKHLRLAAHALGTQLVQWLDRCGADLRRHAEVWLQDDSARIRGRPDLLVTVPNGHYLLDYKTGRPDERELVHQVAVYSWLARQVGHGSLLGAAVAQVGIGIRVLPMTDVQVNETVRQLIAARATAVDSGAPASAAPDHCGFCPERPSCNDYWRAGAPGRGRTSVKGRVLSIEQSSSGNAALRLGTENNEIIVVSGLAKSLDLGLGRKLQILDVSQAGDTDHVYRADRWTRVYSGDT